MITSIAEDKTMDKKLYAVAVSLVDKNPGFGFLASERHTLSVAYECGIDIEHAKGKVISSLLDSYTVYDCQAIEIPLESLKKFIDKTANF